MWVSKFENEEDEDNFNFFQFIVETFKYLFFCLFVGKGALLIAYVKIYNSEAAFLLVFLFDFFVNLVAALVEAFYWVVSHETTPVVGSHVGVHLDNYFHYNKYYWGFLVVIFWKDPVWFLFWFWDFFKNLYLPIIFFDIQIFFKDLKSVFYTFIHNLFFDYTQASTWYQKLYAILKLSCYLIFILVFIIFILTNIFFGDIILKFLLFFVHFISQWFWIIFSYIKDLFN